MKQLMPCRPGYWTVVHRDTLCSRGSDYYVKNFESLKDAVAELKTYDDLSEKQLRDIVEEEIEVEYVACRYLSLLFTYVTLQVEEDEEVSIDDDYPLSCPDINKKHHPNVVAKMRVTFFQG